MDLYQRLGVQRGASEAEIKKAYRSLAKQLHPDRNKDNPNAAKRFGEVTAAYDLLSDKDKRARYDRGEIDEEGNPKMPFGSAGFGGGGYGGARPGQGGGSEGFEGGFSGDTADLSDLFEGLFGGSTGRRQSGGFGGFRQRARPPQKGADIAYRLTVPFIEAATLTPQRITESYAEFFAGLDQDPLEHLRGAKEFTDESAVGELVLLRDIGFRSMCEHHLIPFVGVAHLAYIPRARIVGLGKLPRVVETLSSRPQLQERLTEEIADALQQGLDPLGVLVVLDARHGCVSSRGTRQVDSSTVTLASRGSLADPATRSGVLALIGAGAPTEGEGAP